MTKSTRKKNGSRSICTFTPSMIPKTPSIFRHINYWNGRARLDFAFSRSRCTMLSLIERKCLPTRRQWAFC